MSCHAVPYHTVVAGSVNNFFCCLVILCAVLSRVRIYLIGTLAFVKVGGNEMDMKLPTEPPKGFGANRLLLDLRDLPENEASELS